mmetsp:Transcript_21806/g.51231  ORF Transcript_21806/g.51231 Transcript_21806/m.51231 type:complete len:247 (-) Transcript_21806:8-748(-)
MEALPGQPSEEKVKQHVAHGLEVVAPALLRAQVCVDRGVASGAREALVGLVVDVLLCLRVAIQLGQSVVDEVDEVRVAAPANEEVLRLDVPVHVVPAVHKLEPGEHLLCYHRDCLEAESPIAHAKEILQRWTKEVHHHDVAVTLHIVVVDVWNTRTTYQHPDDCSLVLQHGVLHLLLLHLDRQLLARLPVHGQVDAAEGAAAKLPAHSVVLSDLVRALSTFMRHPQLRVSIYPAGWQQGRTSPWAT